MRKDGKQDGKPVIDEIREQKERKCIRIKENDGRFLIEKNLSFFRLIRKCVLSYRRYYIWQKRPAASFASVGLIPVRSSRDGVGRRGITSTVTSSRGYPVQARGILCSKQRCSRSVWCPGSGHFWRRVCPFPPDPVPRRSRQIIVSSKSSSCFSWLRVFNKISGNRG